MGKILDEKDDYYKTKGGFKMTRGIICEVCKKFFPNDEMNRIHKEIFSIKKSNKTKVKHICQKCFKKLK